MIHTPFLDKKYKIVFQNFLYIEYYKKFFFLSITKGLVTSAAFFIEKGIVEGIPTNLHKSLGGLFLNYKNSPYHRFDFVNSFFLMAIAPTLL